MLVMATVALTASAKNTLRDNGTFTLQGRYRYVVRRMETGRRMSLRTLL